MKKTLKVICLTLMISSLFLGLLVCAPTLARIFFFDTFIVPTESMTPTLHVGDTIRVNKLIFGARLYLNPFGIRVNRNPTMIRLPGLRSIQHNDIIVFNAPTPYDANKIEFKINYVFCKRCVGLPGDSISFVGGICGNNNFANELGVKASVLDIENDSQEKILTSEMEFLRSCNDDWRVCDFGPLYIPKKGDCMKIDASNYKFYKKIIEYETGELFDIDNNCIMKQGNRLTEFVFGENYYFSIGDNIINSCDSRHWGFIPEKYIIGIMK